MGRVVVGFLLFCFFPLIAQGQTTRVWKDASGKFKIEATLVEVQEDTVILERPSGERLKIALNKLSKEDQAAAKEAMEGDGENPFQVIDEPKAKPKPKATQTPAEPRVIKVDIKDARRKVAFEIGAQWNLNLGEPPPATFRARPVSLPPMGKYEIAASLIANERCKRAVITYMYSLMSSGSKSARVILMDLERGEVIGSFEGPGNWCARSLHDDGERIVVADLDGNGRTATIRITEEGGVGLDLWNPFETSRSGGDRNVKYCSFLNNDRLLTMNDVGDGAIWDFERRKPLVTFRVDNHCWPLVNRDRTMLGFCGNGRFGMMPLNHDVAAVVRGAPGMGSDTRVSFSPSGRRFAAKCGEKVRIWEVATGEPVFEGEMRLFSKNTICMVDDEFVLFDDQILYDTTMGVLVWKYEGISTVENFMGETLVASVSKNGGKVFLTQLPHDEARQAFERAKTQPDLFILKKGSELDLDLTGLPPQYHSEASAGLQSAIQAIGCSVRPGAPLRLVAAATAPKSERVGIIGGGPGGGGEFTILEVFTSVKLVHQNEVIWQRSVSNIPGYVTIGGNKSVQQQLDEVSNKPTMGLFKSLKLPSALQKTSSGIATLGQSRIED